MSDTRDPRSVIDAAEQAAAAGDHASAERLLREAATLQEAALGPQHPDLANTLNNLAIVCEIVGKPDEAERCFRRAYTIAIASLEPDHPFVATSKKNLEDFCAASGKAVDLPKPPPLVTDILTGPPLKIPSTPESSTTADPPRAVEPPRAPSPPPTIDPIRSADAIRTTDPLRPAEQSQLPNMARESSRGLVVAALVAGVLLASFLAGSRLFRGNEPADSLPSTPPAGSPAPAEPPAARPEPKRVAPPPKAELAPKSDSVGTAPKKSEAGNSEPTAARANPIAGPRPFVVDAQLCRDRQGGPGSDAWRCDPPGRPAAAGRLVFYTRLRSPRDTKVRHSWYQGSGLRQSVELTIRANPGSGYRTYSRHTVMSGEWRVELRSQDGTLLHEERFSVR